MADAPKAGGLENIVGAATAIGGGVLGNSLASYLGLGALGLLYALPAYFLGKGVVGGYGKALVDNIASGFKGIATYGAKFEKGVRDIGNGIARWYQNFPDGLRNLGENLYTRGANAWNYIRNLGRQAPVAAPAPAAGH